MLTETGYLMLVKTFRDPLAWQESLTVYLSPCTWPAGRYHHFHLWPRAVML